MDNGNGFLGIICDEQNVLTIMNDMAHDISVRTCRYGLEKIPSNQVATVTQAGFINIRFSSIDNVWEIDLTKITEEELLRLV